MSEIEGDLAEAMPLDIVEEESGEAEVLKVFQKGVNPGDKKEGIFAGCAIKRCGFLTCSIQYFVKWIFIYRRRNSDYSTGNPNLQNFGCFIIL